MLTPRVVAEPIDLGAEVPAVVGTDDVGDPIDFAALGRSGFLFVFFYPKADSNGCAAQGCSLRNSYTEIESFGVQVVGVSLDDVATQNEYRQKYFFQFPLVSDENGKVADAFGVPTTGGVAARQSFLFKNGKLVWRDLKARTTHQADDLLAALKAL